MKLKEYVEARKGVKKAVAKARQKERKRFGERLNTKEGQRSVHRIAKQMAGERKDIVGMSSIKMPVLGHVALIDTTPGTLKRNP